MNTPRSRAPKRHSTPRPKTPSLPQTGWVVGALMPEPYLIALAKATTRWPYLEESMTEVLSSLLGAAPRSQVALPLWRTIVSTEAKIKAMRALLEELPHNDRKSAFYDSVIDEFERLSKARNAFVHGGWSTHQDGDVFLSASTPAVLSIMQSRPRKVSLKEVEDVAQNMQDLWMRIAKELRQEHELSSLPKKRARQALPQK